MSTLVTESTFWMDDVSRAEFMKNDSAIIDTFWTTFLGFLSLKVMFTDDVRLTNYFKNMGSLKLDDMTIEDNNDFSFILRVMKARGFISEPYLTRIAKFTALLKMNKVRLIDKNKMCQQFLDILFKSIKPCAMIRDDINEFINKDATWNSLFMPLYKYAKMRTMPDISQEFVFMGKMYMNRILNLENEAKKTVSKSDKPLLLEYKPKTFGGHGMQIDLPKVIQLSDGKPSDNGSSLAPVPADPGLTPTGRKKRTPKAAKKVYTSKFDSVIENFEKNKQDGLKFAAVLFKAICEATSSEEVDDIFAQHGLGVRGFGQAMKEFNTKADLKFRWAEIGATVKHAAGIAAIIDKIRTDSKQFDIVVFQRISNTLKLYEYGFYQPIIDKYFNNDAYLNKLDSNLYWIYYEICFVNVDIEDRIQYLGKNPQTKVKHLIFDSIQKHLSKIVDDENKLTKIFKLIIDNININVIKNSPGAIFGGSSTGLAENPKIRSVLSKLGVLADWLGLKPSEMGDIDYNSQAAKDFFNNSDISYNFGDDQKLTDEVKNFFKGRDVIDFVNDPAIPQDLRDLVQSNLISVSFGAEKRAITLIKTGLTTPQKMFDNRLQKIKEQFDKNGYLKSDDQLFRAVEYVLGWLSDLNDFADTLRKEGYSVDDKELYDFAEPIMKKYLEKVQQPMKRGDYDQKMFVKNFVEKYNSRNSKSRQFVKSYLVKHSSEYPKSALENLISIGLAPDITKAYFVQNELTYIPNLIKDPSNFDMIKKIDAKDDIFNMEKNFSVSKEDLRTFVTLGIKTEAFGWDFSGLRLMYSMRKFSNFADLLFDEVKSAKFTIAQKQYRDEGISIEISEIFGKPEWVSFHDAVGHYYNVTEVANLSSFVSTAKFVLQKVTSLLSAEKIIGEMIFARKFGKTNELDSNELMTIGCKYLTNKKINISSIAAIMSKITTTDLPDSDRSSAIEMISEVFNFFDVQYSKDSIMEFAKNFSDVEFYLKHKAMVDSITFGIIHSIKDKEIIESYLNYMNGQLPGFSRSIISSSVVDSYIHGIANDEKTPIKPEVKLTTVEIKKLLKWNNFTITDKLQFKKDSESWLDYCDSISKNIGAVEMPKLYVDDSIESESELIEASLRLNGMATGRHGDTAVEVLDIFNVSLPNEKFSEWQQKFPGQEKTFFHGCGTIAASMILRFGFRIVPSGDAKTGRMLGDGIYLSPAIDKVAQYVGDSGYTRKHGIVGYILEVQTILGENHTNYEEAGTSRGDGIRSPEYCVKSIEQLKIVRAYKVRLTSKKRIDELKAKLNPKTESMDDLGLMEVLPTNKISFTFYDMMIPISNTETKHVSVLKFSPIIEMYPSQFGVTLSVANDFDTYSVMIPNTDEFMDEDPDNLFDLWLKLTNGQILIK